MKTQKFDAWMDTGVCVTLPADVDATTSEGMEAVRQAAVEAFIRKLNSGEWIDVAFERFSSGDDE
jgi:hypothetical protein